MPLALLRRVRHGEHYCWNSQSICSQTVPKTTRCSLDHCENFIMSPFRTNLSAILRPRKGCQQAFGFEMVQCTSSTCYTDRLLPLVWFFMVRITVHPPDYF